MKLDEVCNYFQKEHHRYVSFMDAAVSIFRNDTHLNNPNEPIIHSIKSRVKSPNSLEDKIRRKAEKGIILNEANISKEITDYVGVRVLHLYGFQAEQINASIRNMISAGDWKLFEEPKAYTWDPDAESFFRNLGFKCEVKPSHYTSLHYVIQPNNPDAKISCEIQVRTLFEEIWGEIDHSINYPNETEIFACKEQLRVLSKLVSTGSRLADSIHKVFKHHS